MRSRTSDPGVGGDECASAVPPRRRTRRPTGVRAPSVVAGVAAFALACLLTLVLLAPAAWAQAPAGPPPFSGRYEGRYAVSALLPDARVQVELELRRSSRYIVYTMQAVARLGLFQRRFRDCSVIEVQGSRLLPLEYVHQDLSDARMDVRTRFDWAAGRADTLLGAATQPIGHVLDAPTWDPMSFQVALMALAPQRRAGEREAHRVIERGAMKHHQVTFAGQAARPDAGDERPVHQIVSRKGTEGDSGRIELWLSPDQAWRPARVAQDGIVLVLAGTPAGAPVTAPASLPDAGRPSCEGGGAG